MDLFKLIWRSKCGKVEYTELDWTDDRDTISRAITRLTQGPGRHIMGEVFVVDALDRMVWQWKDGKVVHG